MPDTPSLTLAWDASKDLVDSYQLYYGTNSNEYNNSINVGTNLTATVTNLNKDTTYYFVVTAILNDIESEPSNEVMATINSVSRQ